MENPSFKSADSDLCLARLMWWNDRYEQELALHSLAGEHGIAPKIVASWLSTSKPRKGHIVMEIVEGPHFKELAQDPEKHKVMF